MIIARSPLRISLGGGATDLESFYEKYEGHCVSAAIDQYVYVAINNTTHDEILLRYSQIEHVKNVNDIHHPIIREALKLTNITNLNLEITSMADQGAGTGLGSSGAFTDCLLKVLHKYKKQHISQYDLAKLACNIEIDILKCNIGKQDQFASAIGGITSFTFQENGNVIPKSLNMSSDLISDLQNCLFMTSTGYYHTASDVLQEQDQKSKANDPNILNNLLYIKELGYKSMECLELGDFVGLGKIMDEHWGYKKQRSSIMSNPKIDHWYKIAQQYGAIGGKLIGSGAGGFLLFVTEDKQKLKKGLSAEGLKETPIKFDFEGTKIL